MLEKKAQLTDETKISGTNWGELKESAMKPNYMKNSTFVSISSSLKLFTLVPLSEQESERNFEATHIGIKCLRQYVAFGEKEANSCNKSNTQVHEF